MRATGRRPAHAPTPGRQEIWEAIRLGRGFFTSASLVDATGAHRKTVEDYLRCLLPGGVIAQKGDSGYELIDDRGHHAPRLNRKGQPVRQGAGVENMWRSMRMLKQFTAVDLAAVSANADVTVTEWSAKSYTSMLLRAGYLRVLRKSVPGKHPATYLLIRNSGPKPPQIQRVKQVYDPNTREVFMTGGGA